MRLFRRQYLIIALTIAVLAVAWFVLRPSLRTSVSDGDAYTASADTIVVRDVVWMPPELIEPASSPEDEYEPAISPDGMTLVFVRGRAGSDADLWMMTRAPELGDHATGWSTPIRLTDVNSDADDLHPAWSRDGSTLFFASDRTGGVGGFDIWQVRRTSGSAADGVTWDAPEPLSANVNSVQNEHAPAFDPTGTWLWFASDRDADDTAADESPTLDDEPGSEIWDGTVRTPRTRGDYDLFRAPVTERGLGTAASVDSLNTRFDETSPTFSVAGDFLYFATDRRGGEGGFDVWRARVRSSSGLTEYDDGSDGSARRHAFKSDAPRPLGTPVNSAANELDPAIGFDGFGIFFSTDGSGNEELLLSRSREIERTVNLAVSPIDLSWLLAILPWIVLALLLLALLLLLRRIDASRRFGALDLLTRCLIASLLVHAVIALLLGTWSVSSALGRWDERGQSRVQLTSAAVGGSDASSVEAQLFAPVERDGDDLPAPADSAVPELIVMNTMPAPAPPVETTPSDVAPAMQLSAESRVDRSTLSRTTPPAVAAAADAPSRDRSRDVIRFETPVPADDTPVPDFEDMIASMTDAPAPTEMDLVPTPEAEPVVVRRRADAVAPTRAVNADSPPDASSGADRVIDDPSDPATEAVRFVSQNNAFSQDRGSVTASDAPDTRTTTNGVTPPPVTTPVPDGTEASDSDRPDVLQFVAAPTVEPMRDAGTPNGRDADEATRGDDAVWSESLVARPVSEESTPTMATDLPKPVRGDQSDPATPRTISDEPIPVRALNAVTGTLAQTTVAASNGTPATTRTPVSVPDLPATPRAEVSDVVPDADAGAFAVPPAAVMVADDNSNDGENVDSADELQSDSTSDVTRSAMNVSVDAPLARLDDALAASDASLTDDEQQVLTDPTMDAAELELDARAFSAARIAASSDDVRTESNPSLLPDTLSAPSLDDDAVPSAAMLTDLLNAPATSAETSDPESETQSESDSASEREVNDAVMPNAVAEVPSAVVDAERTPETSSTTNTPEDAAPDRLMPDLRPAAAMSVPEARVSDGVPQAAARLVPTPELSLPPATVDAPPNSDQNDFDVPPTLDLPPADPGPDPGMQSDMIRGRVVHVTTGAPISGAVVSVDRPDGNPVEVRTDSNGRFNVMLPPGPPFLALAATHDGFVPASLNVARPSAFNIPNVEHRIELIPQTTDVIAIEANPEVHHLGDDQFSGSANSRFQKKSEGRRWRANFEIDADALDRAPDVVSILLLARGCQRDNVIRLNGRGLGVGLNGSPDDGRFGLFRIRIPIDRLVSGRNSIEIRSVRSGLGDDIDDFEFINVRIDLRPESAETNPGG